MRAMDVMTSEVITVDENATVPEAAKLLAEYGISAVPVVDKGNRVIGMVSEGDLLHRAETGTERRRSWWPEMVSSTNELRCFRVLVDLRINYALFENLMSFQLVMQSSK